MHARTHFVPLLALVLLAVLAALAGPVVAQEPPGRLTISVGAPGRRDVPLALPRPKGAPGDAQDEFWAVVRRDLELSGWFTLIDPKAFVEPASAGVRPGEFDFQDWKVPGATVLAKTVFTGDAERIRAEAWVYDVDGARKLDDRAFSGPTTARRAVAHRVANAIILAVTGREGFFDTRFAAVNNQGGNKEVYLVDVDGHGVRQLTRNGSINLQPAWSPRGDAISWTSYRAGNPDLYVMDLVKGAVRRVSARQGINTGGAWSPLGDLLAVTLSFDSNPDIFTIDAYSGKEVARLTRSPGIDTSPAWSPDGRHIAFVSERSGGAQIYVMSASGGDARRVTFHGGHNTDPCFSPDGSRIAYVSRDSRFDVFVTGIDGRGTVRLTQGQGDNEDPSWSPDGRYVAFSSTRTGKGHIWISTDDGRFHAQVTQDGGGWSNPSWSPRLSW